VTTDPNEVVQPLHNRMPAIVPERDYDRWHQPGDPSHPPVDLLRPFDADKMTAWKVDKVVGNVKNDCPDLIEPISGPPEPIEDGSQDAPGSLFDAQGLKLRS
jgi:putative SOS response-associated peptidase YedK